MVRNENFVTLQGWMRNELNLKGNELMVYAIIYGFTQTEEMEFRGSLKYLAEWMGTSKRTVMNALKNLVDGGLNLAFGLHVDGGGCLVENDNRRVS